MKTTSSTHSSYHFTLIILFFFSCSPNHEKSLSYLAQQPPTTTPEIFSAGFISTENEYEFGSVFNSAGTEFFYGVSINGKEETRYSRLNGDTWSKPITILKDSVYGYNDPFLSPDENRLYFISRRALDGISEAKDYDIWYVEKDGDGWSEPINAGDQINTKGNEYYISFTNEGAMYFSSNRRNYDFDIYKSQNLNGEFQPPVRLGDSINTYFYEGDVFVDPNEDYLIFCAQRSDGYGRGDLYISFRNEDGSWTESRNMGSTINTNGHELCPFVTKDGKYFFYTSNEDIYWVDAQVIQDLKENPAPKPILNRTYTAINSQSAKDSLEVLRQKILKGKYPYIDAIVIAQNNETIIDEYFHKYDKDSIHDLRSSFKSVISLLAGIAVDQGLFTVNDKVGDYLTEWKDDKRGSIKIKHFLEMRSGIACEEFFDEGPNCESAMWDTDNWLAYNLSVPVRHTPGTKWEYSSLEPDLVGVIISRASKMPLVDFAKKHLFEPLEIEDYSWYITPEGRGYGGGSFYMKPTDMLKIAQLVSNNGEWKGSRIVSKEWIKESTNCEIPVGMSFLGVVRTEDAKFSSSRYGYFWYREVIEYKDIKTEVLFASGNGGQYMMVLEDYNAAIAFTGSNFGNWKSKYPFEILLKYIIPILEEVGEK
ncbi:MAG: serine hydrolase [bacterium]|nr:serine hydrolase [bacterium]